MVNRLRTLRLLTILLLLTAVGGARMLAQPPAVTIDTLMAAPFPTELVAAPAGGAIAWVASASGVNNVWVAEAPDYRGRAVTTYPADDGLWITELGWTSDAKHLVYVRGDSGNRQGESPNPAQLQDGTDQSVFVVDVAGGTPRRLGPGSSPAASTRGTRVAWVSRGQIWSVDVGGTDKPAQLVNARGGASNLSWSPDGTMLAFSSNRGTHSYIGLFTLAARELRYLDPSLDRDANPVWSPDGTRIAWMRQAAAPRPAHVRTATHRRRTVVVARRRREDRVKHARCGAPTPATAARSRRSSPTASCIGAPAIGSSSRGRRTAGCTSTRCRSRAAAPRC